MTPEAIPAESLMAPIRPVDAQSRGTVLAAWVVLLLLGLPLSVWLDLRNVTQASLHRQASDLNAVINGVRGFYGTNVVGRVLAAPGVATQVTHNYESIRGAIPIPATLSLELGQVISAEQKNIHYRFVSDYPFKNRAPHKLDDFEKDALKRLRADPSLLITEASGSPFNSRVRLVAPIVMGQACVACHNSHPESTKRDWKVGDVRGIQEVEIARPLADNIFGFKYLLSYFLLMAASGLGFILFQRRQAAVITGMNKELESANEFLDSLSKKISHYLSPQIYKSIFSGRKEAAIHTERKKLTIFFSDIKDFTATTERLQPELITRLLNEYFTEMSSIALRHGGTIDKFVGDAMLIFFGDPETKGEAADAAACMRMAFEMQGAIARLDAKWRKEGIENPFRARMGVNTGYCSVGNFGGADRMDYTIIGGEANLAARLQSVADPGHIVVSYETFALVRDMIVARQLPPITVKGIGRAIIPYAVDGMLDSQGVKKEIFSEHAVGLDFYLDPAMLDGEAAARVRAILENAAAALRRPSGKDERSA